MTRRAASASSKQAPGLTVAAVAGPAARAGLRTGDRLVEIDGAVPVDVLDLDWAAADGAFDLVAARGERRVALRVVPDRGEWHGIELAGGLGDEARTCMNACSFCFVDQMPRGLRASLYIKDDDYRLSFLHGNFITLSNLAERDLRRIERLRLSPLYVSLHAWDDEVRTRLMGPATRSTRGHLQRLAAAGIEMHVQVVLCPGHNDRETLRETVLRLADVDGIRDVGVVPVSLAAEGVLRRVSLADARATAELVEALQPPLAQRLGRRFVHAADEIYLLAGLEPPATDAPQQYENGIGMAATFLREAAEVRSARCSNGNVPPVALLCGTLAEPLVARACRTLGAARAFSVENRLFGAHVTVSGLLGGADVLRALQERPLALDEWLLAPRAFLPADLGRTLDDVTESALSEACHGRLVVADGLGDAFATLPGP